ncbi:von Willebrand factor A domain-containing protein 7-like [Genypterus blacodes]|uniref:von Willebrand factor A domain-containing protein 7-like n=1 Tax=Genypterus blacodes TaxID=154954 RepID=UPI003F7759B9
MFGGGMSSTLATLCLLLLQTGAQGFGILPGKSLNHLEITEKAILKSAVQVCRSLALTEGTGFTTPPEPLGTEAVAVACGAPKSAKNFRQAIQLITLRNVRVDLRHALNASFHFDDEMFAGGKSIIVQGLAAVKASNRQGNYEAAREMLGEILHPAQDFYSHSDWVELGNKLPNSNLIKPGASIGNIAEESRATCRNCVGDDCRNNILDDIIRDQILTSGYFGIVPFSATKPTGKCSHGGAVDATSSIEPKGGINKDTTSSSHGFLHMDAANVATAASIELLEDIRRAAGDREFLQMLGISKGSSKALCFVIDTTESMSDDIAAVKNVTSSIISSKVGTDDEPSVYILVPFNDPVVGPLRRTTDPNLFRNVINSLAAKGGGDLGEPSLSGLRMALTTVPPGSEIFLFTDGPAKDKQLKSAVIALIERRQTVVNFLISGAVGPKIRKQRDTNRQQVGIIPAASVQLYRDLAQTSGGKAIEVDKTDILAAASIIIESSTSSQVILVQAARRPGRTDTFTFTVDESVKNPSVFITGRSLNYTVTDPSGASQKNTDSSGSLITSSNSVGNFQILQLKTQVGQWKIKMESTHPYTVKVIGQSPVDFLFNFVEASQGLFKGFDVLDSRPNAGVEGTLQVSVSGSDTATITEVALVLSSGSGEIKASVESQGSGNFLARVAKIPSEEFTVRVKGQADTVKKSMIFERMSSTSLRGSNVTVTADSDSTLVPGEPLSVPFSVSTSGNGGKFIIRATNDQSFTLSSPSSLIVETGNSTNSAVSLLAPLNTPSGNDVTLTIEAEAEGSTDTNYVVLRISVISTVTDFTAPVCRLRILQSDCSSNCSLAMWKLSVSVTDGDDGTGVDRVSLKQGNGNLTITTAVGTTGKNETMASYIASCCSPDVELLTVDKVGNVGSCTFTIRPSTPSLGTKPTLSSLLHLSATVILGLHTLGKLGIL